MSGLWEKIIRVSERATQMGAIERIESNPMIINDSNISFIVSVAKSLLNRPFNFQKSNSGQVILPQVPAAEAKPFVDPFMPCDKDLFVQELAGGSHNLVLNKFNVSNYHSIIATKEFEHQTDPLNRKDFTAIWECMRSASMLTFFNCGPNSGASQPHKHVQLLALPFDSGDADVNRGLNIPMESLINRYSSRVEVVSEIAELPFKNALLHYDREKIRSFHDDNDKISTYLESNYISLLKQMKLEPETAQEKAQPPAPHKSYNFIMTKEWMFLVPRSVYQSRGISINSVGFTGAILVRKEEDLSTIKDHGIMNILKEVSVPKDQ